MTPAAARFEPFDERELEAWLDRSRRNYVEQRMLAGDSAAEAAANADASFARTFPHGTPAPGQLVGHVVVDGRRVGHLWVGPAGADPARWWVWDVEVAAPLRRRGYGRAAMVLAEELARRAGAGDLGLNVFAHNEGARSLYRSLGYAETAVQMRKKVGGGPAPGA